MAVRLAVARVRDGGDGGRVHPDLTKAKLVVSSGTVEHLRGVPFDWDVFHTVGGAFIAILIGVVIVAPADRRRVGALLSIGAASHLLADALLLSPSGRTYALLWPFTRWHPPTPGLDLSTQPEPTIVAGLMAGTVWARTRYRAHQSTP